MEGHLPECYLEMEAGGTFPRPGSVVRSEGGVGAGKEESSGRRSLLMLQEPTLDGLLLLSWRWWKLLPDFGAERGTFLGLGTHCQVSAIGALSGWSVLG